MLFAEGHVVVWSLGLRTDLDSSSNSLTCRQFCNLSVPLFLLGKIPSEDSIEVTLYIVLSKTSVKPYCYSWW